jgi:stage IV sporulation protein FB
MAISFSIQTGRFEVGRFQKAPIFLHPAFFITALLLAWPFWSMTSLRGLALGVLFVAVILASILAHELAHAKAAHRYGGAARRIDIHMLGGVVQFWQRPHALWQDFLITLAGPASNLAIALVALSMLAVMPHAEDISRLGGPPTDAFLETLLRASAYLNFGLCLVNLIPAYPLDGGKLLFLLVEARCGARNATFVVSGLGLIFAAGSTMLLVSTTLIGLPIWSPPRFAINWRAFQAWRQGLGGWEIFASA